MRASSHDQSYCLAINVKGRRHKRRRKNLPNRFECRDAMQDNFLKFSCANKVESMEIFSN